VSAIGTFVHAATGAGHLVDLGLASGRIVEYFSFLTEAGSFRCERFSVLMFLDYGGLGVESVSLVTSLIALLRSSN
jgi:hypothetical protein